MKKLHVVYFRKYIASFVIMLSVLIVGAVAMFGHSDAVYTSNVVNGAYYSGDENSSNVSLMINVYWGDEYLPGMLDVLKNKGVKATFFVGGTWATKNEDLLKRIVKEGHEIGNHAYSHKDCDKLSSEKFKDELSKTHNIVKAYTGVEMDLFAPPSGAFDENVVLIAEECGYKTIMWSKDTIDWRDKDVELIKSRATKNGRGGDLILMHPTQATLDALSDIINYYQTNNYNLVTVSKNINS